MRRDTALPDILSSAINYARTFVKECDTLFVDARNKDTLNGIVNYNVIRIGSQDTNARYASVGKLLVLNPHLILFLK